MDFLERYAGLFIKYPETFGFFSYFNNIPEEMWPLFEAANVEIIESLVLKHDKQVALVYLNCFPRYWFLFDRAIRADVDVARMLIVRSGGTLFSNLPGSVRENEDLALFAFELFPMIGYSIHYKIRRKIVTLAVACRVAEQPNDVLSLKMMRFIPAPVRRQYARDKLAERAAFRVFLRTSLPATLNQVVGAFLGLALGRKPPSGCKKIYWPLYLKREAGKRQRA